MIVTSYSVTYCIYIPEKKPWILFSLLLHSLRWVQIVGYVLACRSYSLVCALYHVIFIILQTYLNTLNLSNASQIYFVECVSKIKHILSVIHHTIYGAVCFQFSVFPWWWLREYIYIYVYTLSYHHHHIGSMDYYPLCRARSWNKGMRCMTLYILIHTSLYFLYSTVYIWILNLLGWFTYFRSSIYYWVLLFRIVHCVFSHV